MRTLPLSGKQQPSPYERNVMLLWRHHGLKRFRAAENANRFRHACRDGVFGERPARHAQLQTLSAASSPNLKKHNRKR
jgi:hypothetical protein